LGMTQINQGKDKENEINIMECKWIESL